MPEKEVNSMLVEQYSMCAARWMQCEEAITRYGLVGKHPTVTTSVVQSPFVSMSHSYYLGMAKRRQAYLVWRPKADRCV